MNASLHTTKRATTKAMAFAALALVLIVSCWLWLSRVPDHGDDQNSSAPMSLAPTAVHAGNEHARLQSEDANTRTEPGDADSRREPVSTTPAAQSTSAQGLLALRVLDNSASGPLRWFNVRLASDTRFAETRWDAATDLQLPLTPGAYELLVLSPGHEAFELPKVEITSGEITRLALIELQPGSGSIQGDVIGDPPPGHELSVELIGEGRHPCEQCGKNGDPPDDAFIPPLPCPHCGFARDRSTLPVRSGGHFIFRNLASGTYALRVSEGGLTVGELRHVVLAAGAISSVVLCASETRSIEVELFDVDGSSLSELWARRLATTTPEPESDDRRAQGGTEPVELRFAIDQQDVAKAIAFPPGPPTRQDGLQEALHNAMMRDLESRQSMAAMHSAMAAALKAQHEGQQFDRARTPTDSLHPSSDDPQFGFAAIPWEIGANGLVRVRPLPTRSLHLLVKMARSSAEVAVPESPETTRVSVHLHAQ